MAFWNGTFADLAPSVDYSQDLMNSLLKLNQVAGRKREERRKEKQRQKERKREAEEKRSE